MVVLSSITFNPKSWIPHKSRTMSANLVSTGKSSDCLQVNVCSQPTSVTQPPPWSQPSQSTLQISTLTLDCLRTAQSQVFKARNTDTSLPPKAGISISFPKFCPKHGQEMKQFPQSEVLSFAFPMHNKLDCGIWILSCENAGNSSPLK